MSYLRSQALYHALAQAMTGETPDTVVLCWPATPYFCVGYHQHPEHALDLGYCRQHGYPVVHRKIGGGTVFLDRHQLFYQVIVHASRAPMQVAAIYRKWLAAPVAALQDLGVSATLEGTNEIEVRGKRIAGTGGGQIEEAVVVTGNLLLSFDYDAMARAWRVPSEAFRALAADGLRQYITTLRQELPQSPPIAEVKRLLADKYAVTLGRPLLPGSLSAPERRAIAQAEANLASLRSCLDAVGPSDRGLKVARATYVRERELVTPAGPVRLTVRLRGGVIDDLLLTGPARSWSALAEGLKGVEAREDVLLEHLRGNGSGEAARWLAQALVVMNGETTGTRLS